MDIGGNTAVITGSTTVGDAALTGSSAAKATGSVEGVTAATLSNATFTDAHTDAPASDFTVTAVTWGDGNTSTAGLTVSGSGGSYTVNGSHLFAEEGAYNFTITVTDAGSNTATITGSTTVGDASLSGSSNATTTGGVEGVTAATLSNATFTEANTGAPASDFTVTAVTWGDGSTDTTGLTVSGSNGTYTVNGSHLYAEDGTYNFSIAVKDKGGSSTTITGTATVADAAFAATGGPAFNAPEGLPFSNQLVATVSDATPLGGTGDFTATIHWGDGNTSTGTVVPVSHGASSSSYQVLGGHTYAVGGMYPVTVSIVDVGGSTANTNLTPTIATVQSNILLLNPTQAGALTVTGQGQIKLSGTVQVDSSSSSALQESAKASISAGHINIVGGDQISGQATTSVPPVLQALSVADPLMALAPPNPVNDHLANLGAVNLTGKNTQTISPGIYTSITVSGQATLTLMPGIYVLAGGGLTVSGQATVNGSGVMIYNAGSNFVNTGAAGGTFGAINVSGQAHLNITPMKSGPYAGIVIFQSGYNSQSGINTQALTLGGQSVLPDGGLVYAPAAQVTLSGKTVLSASVIASTLNVSGNAIVQSVAIRVPGAQTADENVSQAISGISIGSGLGGSVTLTLAVGHGTLTLGSTSGLTVTSNGSGAVTLTGSTANLNAALATLLYRGGLNYSGADTLSLTASGGSSAQASVAITVVSVAQGGQPTGSGDRPAEGGGAERGAGRLPDREAEPPGQPRRHRQHAGVPE
jgi:hypothetical protein